MPYDLQLWVSLVEDKPPEAWLAIIGGSLYATRVSGHASLKTKFLEGLTAGIFSIAIGPDVIEVTGYPPAFVHFVVASFGFAILDIVNAIMADKTELVQMGKAFIKTFLRIDKRDGNKNDGGPV